MFSHNLGSSEDSVCVCVHAYVGVCVHAHMGVCVCVHVGTCVCMHKRVHVCPCPIKQVNVPVGPQVPSVSPGTAF